jgi:hypothetical protein
MVAGYNTISMGSGRKEFHPKKPRPGLEEYMKEAGQNVLKQIGGAGNVDECVVGNFIAARYNNQANLAAFFPTIDEGLKFKPCVRVEGACGTGALALVAGIKSVLAETAEVVLDAEDHVLVRRDLDTAGDPGTRAKLEILAGLPEAAGRIGRPRIRLAYRLTPRRILGCDRAQAVEFVRTGTADQLLESEETNVPAGSGTYTLGAIAGEFIPTTPSEYPFFDDIAEAEAAIILGNRVDIILDSNLRAGSFIKDAAYAGALDGVNGFEDAAGTKFRRIQFE